ncbi:MAG: hypothetical protein ACP5SI_13330, partial [Chloroflexia bacterium]
MDERFREAIAFCEAGSAAYEAGAYLEAQQLYRKACISFSRAAVPKVEREANLAAVWLNLGGCAYALARYPEASRCYRRAASLYR